MWLCGIAWSVVLVALGVDVRIPRVLHQSWKDERLPSVLTALRQSCIANTGNDWQQSLLWTDVQNRKLFADHYAWFLPTYDALPQPVMRADVARYAYLHKFGGVYIDLDVYCLKSLNTFLRSVEESFSSSESQVLLCPDPSSYSNAVMASMPGVDFWLGVLKEVQQRASASGRCQKLGPIGCTGPHLLSDIARKVPLAIAPCSSSRIFPYTWHYWNKPLEDGCKPVDTYRCATLFPDAWMVHFWAHTWLPIGEDRLRVGKASDMDQIGYEL